MSVHSSSGSMSTHCGQLNLIFTLTVYSLSMFSHRSAIADPESKLSYLIDTGAEISVLLLCPGDRRNASGGIQLQAANGTSIRTFGERSVQLDLGLAKSFTWKFTIAEVTKPIIGADFLRYFGLLVDVGRKRLMDAETFLTVPASYRHSAVSKLCVLVQTDQYSDILNEFMEVTVPCIKKCRLQGKVEHHIDTRCSRPVFARPRRLSPDKRSVAKEEFQTLLEMNIIRPSNSPWASPLHMVAKPSGGWRSCGAYRALNAVSENDRYSMPHLQDFAINLEGKKHFLQNRLSTRVQSDTHECSRYCEDGHSDAFRTL